MARDDAKMSRAGPASSGSSHLTVDDVRLVYQTSRGPLPALDGLAFAVARGAFVSVLGPSGCGKSTLLRLASGLIRPTSGRMLLGAEEIAGPRSDVGIVFQQPTLLPWRTVLDNVLLPIRALRRDARAHRARALELIELVGLAEFARHYPHELSGGMQQRVGIARGLVHDPAVLLMDEPFASSCSASGCVRPSPCCSSRTRSRRRSFFPTASS